MRTDADDRRDDEPWHPIGNKVDLKTLGKFLEELGEAVSAGARCIIQGIDGCEPVTGKPNETWLEEELADIAANAQLVVERFNLSRATIEERKLRKMEMLRKWHEKA